MQTARELTAAADRLREEGSRDIDVPGRMPTKRGSGEPMRAARLNPWMTRRDCVHSAGRNGNGGRM